MLFRFLIVVIAITALSQSASAQYEFAIGRPISMNSESALVSGTECTSCGGSSSLVMNDFVQCRNACAFSYAVCVQGCSIPTPGCVAACYVNYTTCVRGCEPFLPFMEQENLSR